MAIPIGLSPTGTVATTVLVAALITETVLALMIRHVGEGPIWRDGDPTGVFPTGMVATTVLVTGSITETVLSNRIRHVARV